MFWPSQWEEAEAQAGQREELLPAEPQVARPEQEAWSRSMCRARLRRKDNKPMACWPNRLAVAAVLAVARVD